MWRAMGSILERTCDCSEKEHVTQRKERKTKTHSPNRVLRWRLLSPHRLSSALTVLLRVFELHSREQRCGSLPVCLAGRALSGDASGHVLPPL